MTFYASPSKQGGRAWGVVMWGIGIASIIVLLVFLQATWEPERWIPVLVVTLPPYFIFMGLAVGAAQLPNAAERLPGHRRFENRYGDPYPPPEK